MQETRTFAVHGMSCAMCVGHVTHALKSVPGVQAAQVRLDAHQAQVTYDPSQTGFAALAEAVAEEGYELREGEHGPADLHP